MTPQEQVKMLREAVQSALTGIDDRYRGSSTHASVPVGSIDSLREALAATAPPKPYRMNASEDSIVRCADGWHVFDTTDNTTDAERAAALSGLNALAEKENAR